MVDGRPELRRAVDEGKDQSYVLASLTEDQLAHALFPLGDTVKEQVRAEAAERGLAVAAKPDSHDICFIPDGDTRSFLTDKLGEQAGLLVDDETGAVLGRHTGVHGFTIGQRHGLGIDAPAPDGRPRYVLALEPVSGTVRVGSAAKLEVTGIDAERPVVHVDWDGLVECTAQVRAHGGTASAVAEVVDGAVRVTLREPLRGVAPGQAVVLYRDDVVLASATITGTR
jgi:tRNA-specific 2-thiouridylase